MNAGNLGGRIAGLEHSLMTGVAMTTRNQGDRTPADLWLHGGIVAMTTGYPGGRTDGAPLRHCVAVAMTTRNQGGRTCLTHKAFD